MKLFNYLLEANLYLIFFYGFYFIALRRETYFRFNRWFLLGAIVSAFTIPSIKLDYFNNKVLNVIASNAYYSFNDFIVKADVDQGYLESIKNASIANWGITFYLIGIAILTIRLIVNLLSIRSLVNKSTVKNKNGFKEVLTKDSNGAFTFGNYLFIGNTYDIKVYEHELAHINQKHYLDLWLMELIGLVCWVNPIVIFYKRSMKMIHEYLADEAVCAQSDLITYAETLVKNAFELNNNHLIHSFYTPHNLKNRLIMLQKNRSSKWALLKYSFVLPLGLSLVFISSSAFIVKKNIEPIAKKLSKAINKPITQVATEVKQSINSNQTESTEKGKGEAKSISSPDSIKKSKKDGSLKEIVVTAYPTSSQDPNEVFTQVEESPEYPGGMAEVGRFLGRNIKYPAEARKKGIQGKVIIGFIVQMDGSIVNVHIKSGFDANCNEEALRVIRMMQKWKPGKQNGKPVNVEYTLPIMFRLDDISPKSRTTNEELINDNSMKLSNQIELPANVLYVIDGVIMKAERVKLDEFTEDKIESIEVIKGKSAIAAYGYDGKNGVIIIKTKKNK